MKKGIKEKKIGRKNKKKSFKWYLIRNLIMLSLIPMLILSIVISNNTSKNIKKNVYTLNNEIAKGIHMSITTSLKDIDSTLNIVSTNKSVMMFNFVDASELLDKLVQVYPSISTIGIIRKDIKKDTGFDEKFKTSGSLNAIPKGDYYKKAIKGKTVITNVVLSPETKQVIIVIAKPVYKVNYFGKRSKTPQAVLYAEINLNYFNNLIKKIKLGEGGYAYIVDNSGKVLSHPDEKVANSMIDLSYLEPVKRLEKGENGIIEYSYKGEKYLATYLKDDYSKWGIVVQQSSKVAFKQLQEQNLIFLIMLVIISLLTAVIALFLSNKITSPLIYLQDKMEKASNGNLAIELKNIILKRKDEFGMLSGGFKNLLDSLKNILKKLKNTSNILNDFSFELSDVIDGNKKSMDKISSNMEDLLLNAENDTASIEQSVKGIGEIVKSSNETAEKTIELEKIVETTYGSAGKGYELMNKTMKSVGKSYNSFEEVNKKMDNLNVSTKNIDGILNKIKGVSDQTNLLALNAAIEAARAGEAGKGFAVVADEIRKLAMQSNTSAEEITKIVEKIQGIVENIIEIFQINKGELKDVMNNAGITQDEIKNIVLKSENALTSVKDISSLTENNVSVTEELFAAMTEFSNSVKSTSEIVKEISNSTTQQVEGNEKMGNTAKDLGDLSRELVNILNHFKKIN